MEQAEAISDAKSTLPVASLMDTTEGSAASCHHAAGIIDTLIGRHWISRGSNLSEGNYAGQAPSEAVESPIEADRDQPLPLSGTGSTHCPAPDRPLCPHQLPPSGTRIPTEQQHSIRPNNARARWRMVERRKAS